MTPARRSLLPLLGFAALTCILLAAIPLVDVVRGAALVVRAAGLTGPAPDRLVAWTAHAFATRDLSVPSRHGALRARLYVPATPGPRAVILTAGVHAQGIDEPRLVKLAKDFASIGVTVLTPELPDLLEYRITPRLPDMLEDAASWASRQPAIAPDGRVGLVGISFSGGLSVVAAGRAAVRDRVAFVVSFGGHGDLGRTLAYRVVPAVSLTVGFRPPHDYGVVIILLNAAERLVPGDQVEPLRAAIRTFLQASHVDMVDHARARLVFDDAIALERTLDEPARTLLHYVNTRDVAHLGPLLLPHVASVTTDPALSAARSPAPSAPVFLLHGTDDNVIPAVESTLLGDDLHHRGTPVRILLSPLIIHAELDKASALPDIWNLLDFWGDVLSR